jgi:hypothetical protein
LPQITQMNADQKIQPLIFTDDTDLNWEIARDRTTSPTSGKRHRPSASTRRFPGVHFDLRLCRFPRALAFHKKANLTTDEHR